VIVAVVTVADIVVAVVIIVVAIVAVIGAIVVAIVVAVIIVIIHCHRRRYHHRQRQSLALGAIVEWELWQDLLSASTYPTYSYVRYSARGGCGCETGFFSFSWPW
jgi:hypothetical protein